MAPDPHLVPGDGGRPDLEKAGELSRLDDPEGEVGIEFMVVTDTLGAEATAYHVPLDVPR